MDQNNTAPVNIPQPSAKPNHLLPVLLTLTSVIFFITTLLFAMQTVGLQNQLNTIEKSIQKGQTSSVSPTVVPSVQTSDLTADWQSYSNSSENYSLKYPSAVFKYKDSSIPTLFLATSKPQGGNTPKFLGKTDLWFEVSTETSLDFPPDTPFTPVTVDGVKGKLYGSNSFAAAGNATIYYYVVDVSRGNFHYAITLSSWNSDTLTNSKTLFNQILSTFKFTSSTTGSNWQTFSNPNNPFTFRYPPNFTYYANLDQTVNLTMFPICDPTATICFFVDSKYYYPGTNFKGAGFSVSTLTKATSKTACDAETVPGANASDPKTLGGTLYRIFTQGSAAAGNQSGDVIYIGWQDKVCYRITVRTVTDSSDVNAPAGQVKPFTSGQSEELNGIFENIIATLKVH